MDANWNDLESILLTNYSIANKFQLHWHHYNDIANKEEIEINDALKKFWKMSAITNSNLKKLPLG